MATASENLQLLIGGKVHDRWESYEIDSDLLVPADAWRVTLGMPGGDWPEAVVIGAPVQAKLGNDVVLNGRIDDIDDTVTKEEHSLQLNGRDGAAVLLDCSAPVFVAKQAGLDEIIAKIVRPLGVSKIRIDAAKTTTREKINVEPGDSAWNVLTNAAEANGLWPWFDPDGTLVVGGPDYSKPPVATLIMRRNGRGNNVKRIMRSQSMRDRYSEVTVLGQTHGTAMATGKNNLRGAAKDDGMSWYRPKIVVDHEADNNGVCQSRARKLLADGRLRGLSFKATVKGHRIVAPGQPTDGLLWQPGQRVVLVSEPHGVSGIYFLMARKFTLSRSAGTETILTLHEDGVWTLDAHPHKNKHRRGKNSLPGKVVDIPGAPS